MSGMRYQPQGRARLDQSNPLVRGLVFASVAGGPDLISGVFPVRMGAGSISAFGHGKTLYTPGVTSDGWYWPLPSTSPLYTIGLQDTIFVLARRLNGSSFNNLLGVPYKSGAWANPYYAWGISGQSDNTMGAYTFAVNSSTRNSTTSASGYFVNGTTMATGGTRNGTRIRFYSGSTQFGGDQTISSGSPDWTNKQPLCLFNRSNTSAGEGMQAHAGLILVWNRELAPDEWASLAQNPWQIFLDLSHRFYLYPTTTGNSFSFVGTGGFATLGTGNRVITKVSNASGGLVLGGTSPKSNGLGAKTTTVTGSGGPTLSGTSSRNMGVVRNPTGSTNVTGSSPVYYYTVLPPGTATVKNFKRSRRPRFHT